MREASLEGVGSGRSACRKGLRCKSSPPGQCFNDGFDDGATPSEGAGERTLMLPVEEDVVVVEVVVVVVVEVVVVVDKILSLLWSDFCCCDDMVGCLGCGFLVWLVEDEGAGGSWSDGWVASSLFSEAKKKGRK